MMPLTAQLMSLKLSEHIWFICMRQGISVLMTTCLYPLPSLHLLPDDDLVIKRAGSQEAAKFWMSPGDLPDRAFMA